MFDWLPWWNVNWLGAANDATSDNINDATNNNINDNANDTTKKITSDDPNDNVMLVFP